MERTNWSQTLRCDPVLPDSFVDRFSSDPDALLADARILKSDLRTTVARINVDGFGPVVVKRYNLKGRLHTAAHSLLQTRARRSWRFGQRLLAGGVPTPRPLACLEQSLGPLRFRAFLLTEFVPGVRMLELLKPESQHCVNLENLAGQFADIWHGLGRLRLRHGDANASNFILGDDHVLRIIDLDAMTAWPTRWTAEMARQRDWARFMRNWTDQPEIAAVFERAVAESANSHAA
jgi:tRNA A-37 threonylcarbamoyl transferase component Bud32